MEFLYFYYYLLDVLTVLGFFISLLYAVTMIQTGFRKVKTLTKFLEQKTLSLVKKIRHQEPELLSSQMAIQDLVSNTASHSLEEDAGEKMKRKYQALRHWLGEEPQNTYSDPAMDWDLPLKEPVQKHIVQIGSLLKDDFYTVCKEDSELTENCSNVLSENTSEEIINRSWNSETMLEDEDDEIFKNFEKEIAFEDIDDEKTISLPQRKQCHLELQELVLKKDNDKLRERLPFLDPNEVCCCQDSQCLSPLWVATLTENTEAVELLIAAGANVHDSYEDKYLLEALDAVNNGCSELIKSLVASKYEGWMMIDAIYKGKIDLIRLLLENGINFEETQRSVGPFPIQLLAVESKIAKDIIPLFIEYGVDVTVKDPSGQNMLHYIVQNTELQPSEIEKLAMMLLDAGVPVDEADDLFGFTPLHLACKVNNELLISSLIIRGADFQKLTKRGLTASELSSLHIKE